MKQPIIKTICAVFFFFGCMTAPRCMAQAPDTAILKMLPAIPAEITGPSERIDWLLARYWDNFNFRDTAFLMADDLLERCFVDYIDLLSLAPDDTRDRSIHTLLKKSEDDRRMFSFILQLSRKYLYEPDSPLLNEENLIPFLQYALQSPLLGDTEKISPQYLLDCISKNRTGNVAGDFTYTLINGATGNLHSLQADYTLLYFNDPECDDCKMLIRKLAASTAISQHTLSGKLKIITVYVNGDLEAWQKHAGDVPPSWIYACDAEQAINDGSIYDIKRFPSLYLLDRDKRVILKDISFQTLEEYLRTLYSVIPLLNYSVIHFSYETNMLF